MTGSGSATDLAEAFLRARPRLVRVAYAVLGTLADAEDVVSDCWFRLDAAHRERPIEDVDAWTTVVVARAALDALRSARVRRESYVGPWLPEPHVAAHAADGPADRVTLDDTVSYALLVALEALTPAERTAWVLHDLFAVPFDEVAETLGRTPAAVRQLASRARRHVAARAPRVDVDPRDHRRAVDAFVHAAGTGDLASLIAVLDPAVRLVSDGGGLVSAARRPVVGADHVARFLLGIAAKVGPGFRVDPRRINGSAGLVVVDDETVLGVMSIVADTTGRVVRIDLIRTPEKLRSVRANATG
ncbi:RNA polymerase sigma factor SigJ [Rhodococcoides corynebacterioides]|uniref:RNA polymerase sigma factor SigJ n=1 Tax=Rhodococcoides corynebacterioides TaxID=53972 RepID=UPI000A9775B4|nr:RNA polymerase sigma factor SigJ [Rhodococcus corynebacterioides]MBY6350762.1 RNA polymerase sigma factor SigJ [Rhodococcus corynebacterioides]MBY6363089.1 RNA polymerase sigma factor SigJ [Rhodococcus corynebacterioides]